MKYRKGGLQNDRVRGKSSLTPTKKRVTKRVLAILVPGASYLSGIIWGVL